MWQTSAGLSVDVSVNEQPRVSLVAKDAFSMLKGPLERQADDFSRSTFGRPATAKPWLRQGKFDGHFDSPLLGPTPADLLNQYCLSTKI